MSANRFIVINATLGMLLVFTGCQNIGRSIPSATMAMNGTSYEVPALSAVIASNAVVLAEVFTYDE